MTLTNPTPEKTALVPTVTGNPMVDTFVGHTLTAVSAAVATAAVVWGDSHGFNSAALAKDGINLGVIYGAVIFAALSGAFSYAWAWLRTHRSQNAIIDGVFNAAISGIVPAPVAAKMTMAQAQAVEASPTAKVV